MITKYKVFLFILSVCVYTCNCVALSGSWRGDISMGPAKVPLVFNFNEDTNGKTTATMDSPQQNVKNIPLEVLFCSNDSISLSCKMINATYRGKVTATKIDGTYVQNGFSLPLVLSPEKDLSERRPQTPVPPFPYAIKDTVFYSADGTQLAGTLTIPESYRDRKCPIVVMVTGSGPQNRDEEIFEHRPFAVIADYLARNGVASFRYDDRGIASSKGNFNEATIDTFKADLSGALKLAKGLSGFGKTGVLGHSEGGTLAFLIAAEGKPDFIVSLAGMAVPAKETIMEQNIHSLDNLGIKDEQREASIILIESAFDKIIEQYRRGEMSPIDVDLICKEKSLDVPPMVLASVKRNSQNSNGYFNSLISLDPIPALKKIKCPVLAINGTKDTQVNAETNLKSIRNNVKKAEIHSMDDLNHLLQHAMTGEMSEYGEINETISPEVLNIITDFIKRQ